MSDEHGGSSFLSEASTMLRFARRNALDLPQGLQRDIAVLDAQLALFKLPTISGVPIALIERPPITVSSGPVPTPAVSSAPTPMAFEETGVGPPIQGETQALNTVDPAVTAPASAPNARVPSALEVDTDAPKSATELLIGVHQQLSKVIAPATPLSLQTSEPPPGRRHLFGGMPPVVKGAAFIALASAVGFVLSAAALESKDLDTTTKKGNGSPAAMAPKPASTPAPVSPPIQAPAPTTPAGKPS